MRSSHGFLHSAERRTAARFHQSILLGVLQAFFEALKIPAIACMVRALLRGSVTTQDILLALGIMLFSISRSSLVKSRA